ncbi:MAG: precorrin-6A reductase [Candidatus Humimicrobiaceae bacterium]
MKILLIGGTADSRVITEELNKLRFKITVTVTTDFGAELLGRQAGITVCKGKLNAAEIADLIKKMRLTCVIDASHPFAMDASKNAIDACASTGVRYLRFERNNSRYLSKNIIEADDFINAVYILKNFKGNIFLATGSKSIELFTQNIKDYKKRLFVRVLPDSSILQKCEKAGLGANNIIAARGPFSKGMNLEMLKHVAATVLVTKDSGKVGGTKAKIEAAEKMGIPVILIKKPQLNYPEKTNSIKKLINIMKALKIKGE